MKAFARFALLGGILLTGTLARAGSMAYEERFIPRFNIPRSSHPPTIDGRINADEWREAVRVMGVVWTSSLSYRDRPVAFWVAWDEKHLYIAARSDILPGHRLYRQKRERYTAGTVFDDAYEFGLFLHDRNRRPNQVSSFLKFILNSLGSGEYMRLYPSIGQNVFNWQPQMQIANSIYEANGRQWWDMEIALSLDDLQMPCDNKAGDPIDILLAADLKNPEWQWLDIPSASGHLEHYGFPRAVLTADRPYVQVEELSGLHDERLALKSVLYNPSDRPVKVKALVRITHGKAGKDGDRGLPEDPTTVVNEEKELTLPPKGSVRLDLARDFPGLAYPKADGKQKAEISNYEYRVTLADDPSAPPVYSYTLDFAGMDKSYLKAVPRTAVFDYEMGYNPVRGLLFLSADTLDAQLPAGVKAAAAECEITKDARSVRKVHLVHYVHSRYEDLLELPQLDAGKYQVKLSLVDAAGKPLASRDDISFEKKDEAKEFADWWGNRLGDADKVLQPFEPLGVRRGLLSPTRLTCARRSYSPDSLGLPRQIEANGGPVLSAPARIVVRVAGKDYVVPTGRDPRLTSRKDWRVEFEGRPTRAAGVAFQSKGSMEQDGLVQLELTYAPERGNVAIEELRVEWPLDDSLGLHMACVGQGGNYCARSIGRVPPGDGAVWNTLDGIGLTGSGMTVGTFTDNFWLGTEQRGLLWAADSDRGWVPDNDVPAHSLLRQGRSVVLRNHIIGTPAGRQPFVLNQPRTIRFTYNATPYRNLIRGWRLNQVSAANGFSGGKYKVNWDTGQDFFSILSPPFPDVRRWPEYYAFCRQEAERISRMGIYSVAARLGLYTNNQIALRGYMNKTVQPGVYEYFAGDWVPGGEVLSPTYRDYCMWLQNRLVREGGCTHFYYDISFTGHLTRALAAGFGYRLPDGRIQPESDGSNLREWYKRVWALMQETGQYPGGVSGHATNSLALRALPFADSILDSEYPMRDPISVYPSDRMIALSCPHSLGVNISHLGFMNPNWPAMHDAVMGGDGGVFNRPDFRHWGISGDDVQFIPYWRNQRVVRGLADGVFVSLWKRPGSVAMAFCNYGPDEDGKEQTRPGRMALDLKALGVPSAARAEAGERLRIRPLFNTVAQYRYVGHLKWYQDLPGDSAAEAKLHEHSRQRPIPPATPRLDPKTGTLDGFDVFYHDVRYLVLNWEDRPIRDAAWKDLFAGDVRQRVLDWGINGVAEIRGADLASLIKATPTAEVRAWRRPGSVLLHVTAVAPPAATPPKAGADRQPVLIQLDLDLARLGVKVEKLWRDFTSVIALDGLPAENLADDPKDNDHRLGRSTVLFNGWTGRVSLRLPPGETRTFCIDKY